MEKKLQEIEYNLHLKKYSRIGSCYFECNCGDSEPTCQEMEEEISEINQKLANLIIKNKLLTDLNELKKEEQKKLELIINIKEEQINIQKKINKIEDKIKDLNICDK